MLAMLNRFFRCVILHTVRLTNENQDLEKVWWVSTKYRSVSPDSPQASYKEHCLGAILVRGLQCVYKSKCANLVQVAHAIGRCLFSGRGGDVGSRVNAGLR